MPPRSRRWPQWHLDDDVTGMWQAAAAWPTRSRATRPIGGWRPRAGATLRDHTPVTAIRDAGGGDLEVVTPDGDLPDGPGRPRRRRLDQRAARLIRPAPAADRHQGAGDLLRLPGPGAPSRPTGSRSGSGWTSRRSTASRPTARPAPRPPRTAVARPVDPGRADIRRGTRRPSPGCEAFLARHLPGAVGPPILYQDLSLHADARPRLGRRPTARARRGSWSRWVRPTASSSHRSSAGSWPS